MRAKRSQAHQVATVIRMTIYGFTTGVIFSVAMIIWFRYFTFRVTAPCPNMCENAMVEVVYASEAITTDQQIDRWVDKYATRYGKDRWFRNRTKALLHYLLLREQNYGGSDKCGDSGLSCGPLQFRVGTYADFRKEMMRKGLTKDMGSRLDMEDAIETAAWAINNGKEKHWGPVLREEIKL